ncbi:MAG: Rrf2 family transcriptional regulator [Coriobacteriia bacterium]|nr:Rrf2 family transcriptional regulator [Coriobacteriia bacterium]
MDVTRRTDYAIRIMLALARAGAGPLSVRDLAERQGVPYAFARSIQRDLVSAGLVVSRRGAQGGILLARPADAITLLDVVEAIQGRVSCAVCVSDPAWCDRMGGCSVHRVWQEVDRLTSEYLGGKSLASLLG